MWRESTPEDDDAIAALAVHLYQEDPASAPVPFEHHVRTLRVLREEPARGRIAVLELDGAVRGYAILIPYWSNELGGEICTIDELYVTPSHRSRGHGGALIESLARGDGPWPGRPVALELEVTPDNARARSLYERLGFRIKHNAVLRRKLAPSS
jgi:ribosomal protein S18 acetylase RimI-like enzyme